MKKYIMSNASQDYPIDKYRLLPIQSVIVDESLVNDMQDVISMLKFNGLGVITIPHSDFESYRESTELDIRNQIDGRR